MEIQAIGADNLPWDHLLMSFSKSGSSMYMMSVNSWDEHKRAATRSVLQQMRTSFHQVPRQGYVSVFACVSLASLLLSIASFFVDIAAVTRAEARSSRAVDILHKLRESTKAVLVGTNESHITLSKVARTLRVSIPHDCRRVD